MTDLKVAPVGRNDDMPSSPRPTGAVALAFLLFALALVLPLVAHGCHGGDEDHEPAFLRPVQAAAPTAGSPR